MADYRNMYLRLFNAVTDSINILQEAQLDTEQDFMSQQDAQIVPLKKPDKIISDGNIDNDTDNGNM